MLLTVTVFVPLAGALLLALVPTARADLARLLGLGASLVALALAVALAARFRPGEPGFQLGQQVDWVRSFGVQYKVGVDGISLPLVLLTAALTVLAVGASWRMEGRVRTYLAQVLVLETAMLGVFSSLDLLLFYVFWEAVLVPGYFLIGGFGGQRRVYAAVKFFVYTLAGGLLMLVGIIALFYLHAHASGTASFDYDTLRGFAKAPVTQRWLFLAFFAAFAVKTPLVPFHTWLPDAYTEAPATTSALLAGVMSKLGAYGFLRMALPLFPDAARTFQPLLLTLAVVGILYCALIAAVQRDFKTLVAYSSVSHLGFITLGIFSLTLQGAQGAVFYMVAHGLIIGALFLLAGMLEEHRGTRRIDEVGGLQAAAPRMAGVMLLLTLAGLALPGLVGFVGEFLVLLGTFLTHQAYAVVALLGVILGAVYLLWAYQRMWQGAPRSPQDRAVADLSGREWAVLAPLVALIVVLGLFPGPVLRRVEPSAQRTVQQATAPAGQRPAAAPRP